MAATIVCSCEVCGVQRAESNHWFMAKVATDASEFGIATVGISFIKWDNDFIMDERYKQLCGPGCASRLLSTTLEAIR